MVENLSGGIHALEETFDMLSLSMMKIRNLLNLFQQDRNRQELEIINKYLKNNEVTYKITSDAKSLIIENKDNLEEISIDYNDRIQLLALLNEDEMENSFCQMQLIYLQAQIENFFFNFLLHLLDENFDNLVTNPNLFVKQFKTEEIFSYNNIDAIKEILILEQAKSKSKKTPDEIIKFCFRNKLISNETKLNRDLKSNFALIYILRNAIIHDGGVITINTINQLKTLGLQDKFNKPQEMKITLSDVDNYLTVTESFVDWLNTSIISKDYDKDKFLYRLDYVIDYFGQSEHTIGYFHNSVSVQKIEEYLLKLGLTKFVENIEKDKGYVKIERTNLISTNKVIYQLCQWTGNDAFILSESQSLKEIVSHFNEILDDVSEIELENLWNDLSEDEYLKIEKKAKMNSEYRRNLGLKNLSMDYLSGVFLFVYRHPIYDFKEVSELLEKINVINEDDEEVTIYNWDFAEERYMNDQVRDFIVSKQSTTLDDFF